MSKTRRLSHKEQDQLQDLKEENRRLKKQVASLRKQLDRLDLDSSKYDDLRELVNRQYEEEEKQKNTKKLKEKWKCFKCGQGTLKLLILDRNDGSFYFRKCDHCDHRTNMQKYNDKIEGIK